MPMTSGARYLLAMPVAIALLSGCGASPAKSANEPSEPAADASVDEAGGDAAVSSAEPPSVDTAAADFESAESSLEGLLAGAGEEPMKDPAPEPADVTPATPEARPHGAAEGRCTRACKALASMRRSADRLCSLTSQDDPRCQNVVDRLERAEQRVKASCPSCGA